MKAILILALLSVSSLAQELKFDELALDGKTFKAVTIEKQDASEAKLTHEGGVRRIAISMLPPEIQTKLGYDASADQASRAEKAKQAAIQAQAEAKAAKQQAQTAKQKEALAKAEEKRFWVQANTEEGLIVGSLNSVPHVVASSSASVGGGGGVASYTSEEKGLKMIFIPHTAATRNLTIDAKFSAKVIPDGTERLDESTVVPRLKLVAVTKAK